MNAIQVLTRDHERIKELFSQFEDSGAQAHKQKQTIARQLVEEISRHSDVEERVFYCAVKERADKKLQGKVLEVIEEHRLTECMMGRLVQTAPEDEAFEPRFRVLMELVEEHLKEEEQEMSPKAQKLLAEDEKELGCAMQALELQMKGKIKR